LAAKDPAARILAARIAAAERWGRERDRSAATQPARDARRARLEAIADPDGALDPVELARRVEQLERAQLLRMSLAAKRARSRRRAVSDAT
jgi:hypothetical protein